MYNDEDEVESKVYTNLDVLSHYGIWHGKYIHYLTTNEDGPGSDSNEGVVHIPQSSKAGTSPLDCLVSYPGHSSRGSYPFAEMQVVYSTAPADRAKRQKGKKKESDHIEKEQVMRVLCSG